MSDLFGLEKTSFYRYMAHMVSKFQEKSLSSLHIVKVRDNTNKRTRLHKKYDYNHNVLSQSCNSLDLIVTVVVLC